MVPHHSITQVMLFSTNQLQSCAFGIWNLRVSLLELKVSVFSIWVLTTGVLGSHSDLLITFDNFHEYSTVQTVFYRDGVLKDWPQPRGHLEDKILWPWPRWRAALALALRSGRKTLNFWVWLIIIISKGLSSEYRGIAIGRWPMKRH